MATTANSDAADVRRRGRHRLIGAIVIAILLVVFVPMILDSEPRAPRETPALDIPSKEKAPPLPPPTPAPAKTQSTEPAPVPPKTAALGKPTAVAKPPAVVPAKADPVVPAKAGTQSPTLEGFAVQVGAFKDEDKLKQARDRLTAAQISHYIERRPSSTGELTRLRAGPYPTRAAAESALAALKLNGLDGQVVPLP